jgi:hypothetical protein
MRGDRLNRNLDRLYRQPAGDLPQRQALEEELLHRYRQTHPRHRRWLMLLNPWNKTARFAVVGLALMLLTVGACTTETSTQIEAGQQGHISFKMSEMAGEKSLTRDHVQAITDFVTQQASVEQVDISVNEMIDEEGNVEMGLELMIWGEGLDAEALTMALQEDFPLLAGADISFEPLSTTITESLFDRFGRQIFNIETEGGSPEEIRAQILQQLAAEGFTGDAQVEVINGDGTQEIKIMLEETIEE